MPDENIEKPGFLYFRKWEISIYRPAYKEGENGTKERDPEHDVKMDVSNLRCIFKCSLMNGTGASIGTLVVYNMNAATETEVIEEGFQFSVYGGYEQGQYGEIYTGDIVQVIRNRENGTDYRLEMIAIRGCLQFEMNHVRAAVAAGSKPRENAKTVCEKANRKVEVGEISENLPEQTLPRGKVFFDKPAKYLRDMCIANNSWYEMATGEKMELHVLTDEIPEDHVLKLTPNTGLVGTPKYTDSGIIIRMLLDARVKLRTLIHIDNEIIQRQLISINPQTQGSNTGKSSNTATVSNPNQRDVFDENGDYQVLSITHSGDTWGDEWFTEVVGIRRNGRAGLPTNVSSVEQSNRM